MRGFGSHIALAALALAGMGSPAIGESASPASRSAIMPSQPARPKKYVREKKNTTRLNPFRRRESKLARRLRRKHELGMNGAF